jgi:hypothetical protein
MATSYLVPGVYVEEKSSGARPIEAVGTSTAAFLGEAPGSLAPKGTVERIDNWSEFRELFCKNTERTRTEDEIYAATATPLACAVFGFFQNGGDSCYVVNVGKGGDISGLEGVGLLEKIDDIAMVAAPGFTGAAAFEALLAHCELMTDRVAILDPPESVEKVNLLTEVATEAAGSGPTGVKPRLSKNGFGAFYFPWIKVVDPLSPKLRAWTPPCGHIAGIYARTDAQRGVFKAPANESVRGALDLKHRVSKQDQALLNPEGVNCIRYFPREGFTVWGARTLAGSGSDWRYLNVRRLFCMIEESISRSTRWIVFEPNDDTLWKAIRRDVSAFLTLLWRQGALMGKAPEDAFFVRCDRETNPWPVIDAGMVRTIIGIAPVKPAEFVIFEVGQTEAGAEITVS